MNNETDKTVVVVDDARINISKAEYILKPKGFNVQGYENPQLFLLSLFKNDIFPDIILLDIEMPGKNGLEVLKEIREKPEFADIPVILVTGHVSPDLVKQAALLKVSGYIKKPFEGTDLLDRINLVLD